MDRAWRLLLLGALVSFVFPASAGSAAQELFRIDARPYEATLKQLEARRARAKSMLAAARAAVTRDKAQASNMQTELQRNKTLLDREMVTRSEYDTVRTQAEATKATVDASAAAAASAADDIRAAEADIENAKLSLAYCIIRSPMNGRTGALLVHVGSLVRNSDTNPLVVINQVSPVYVSFAVPARLLEQIRGERAHQGLRVLAAPAGTTDAPVTGSVTFLDNAVDPTTDTIRLKATFPNKDRRLWPGAFVDVTLRLSETPNALVVPNSAVQASQTGELVYVVKADQTVETRQVTVGWIEGDESVISSGLKAGETIVTDGQLRLVPGAKVVAQGREPQRGQQP